MAKQLKYKEFIRANQFNFLKERIIIKQEIIQIWITQIKRISRNQDKDFKIMKTDPDNQDMIQQLLNDAGRAKLRDMSELNVQIFNAHNVKSQDIFVINATR